MTVTMTIQNADNNLLNAIKALLRLAPNAHVTMKKSKDDGFYSEENIKYLEDLKKRDDEGKLHFVTKTWDELKAMEK